jgi:hypothetical protein
MDKKRLLQTIADLRREIGDADAIDPDTRGQLEKAMDELVRKLDASAKKTEPDIEPASSGLREALLRFEAEHPQLSESVGNVANALAAMGI